MPRDLSPADPRLAGCSTWLFGPGRTPQVRRVLLVLLIPLSILAGTLCFDFVFDDNWVVLRDPLITGPIDFQRLFRGEVRVAEVSLGYYRPIITLLYRIDRALWGMNPAGYHLTNLLWHVLATYLVYRVGFVTTGQVAAAWGAAVLFAVLPAHSEAIGWIQGRVDLVSTVFALLALLALLRVRETAGARAWVWGWPAGLMYLAALLAKESAAPLPLAWAMWEASTFRKDRWREHLPRTIGRLLPLCLAGLAYWGLRHWAVGNAFGFFRMSTSPFLVRILAVPSVLAEYVRILILPGAGLNFHRSLPSTPAVPTLAFNTVIAVGVAVLLAVSWHRVRPLFPWAAWVPITLLPALLFVLEARSLETGFFVAERFLYLPSVGWCVLAGYAVGGFLEGRQGIPNIHWGRAIFGVVLMGYAALTIVRLLPWADAADLYRAMKAQTNMPVAVQVLVHNNLGEVYLERGELSAAQGEFQEALRLKPDYAFAQNNIGVLLIRQGQPGEARRWLEAALRLDPNYSDAYGNLGAAYEALGDLQAARRAYELGLRVAPSAAWLARGLARVNREEMPPRLPQVGRSP